VLPLSFRSISHLYLATTSEFLTQWTNCKHQQTRVNKGACGLVIAWTDDVPGIIITGLPLQPFVSLSGVMSCIYTTQCGGGGDAPPHSGVCAFRLQSTTGAVIKAAAAATAMHSLFNHTSRIARKNERRAFRGLSCFSFLKRAHQHSMGTRTNEALAYEIKCWLNSVQQPA
jgi:hypothetical protein